MGLKQDVMEMKREVKEVKEERRKSFAYELLEDYKRTNKRQFVTIIVILIMWFATIGLFVYYINTVDYEETTEYATTDDGGNACVGDSCNNGEINYGDSSEKN